MHPWLASDSPHSQDDLEFRFLLTPPPECWDDWCVALWMNLRVLRLYSSGQAPYHLVALPIYHQAICEPVGPNPAQTGRLPSPG